MAMDTILDRIQIAFGRLFQDLLSGSLSDVVVSDVGIVFATSFVPMVVIASVMGGLQR